MSSHESLTKLTSEQQRDLLAKLLAERAKEDTVFPMSIQQRSLWYDYQRDPDSAGYNVFLPSRTRSRLDTDAMHDAIRGLTERHASLRTTFGFEKGRTYQQVHSSLPPEFRIVDAAGLDENEIRAVVAAESTRPFDLESGPLLRLILFRVADDDWIILAVTHHIVVDFWSLVLMLRDVRVLYEQASHGQRLDLPLAPSNYGEFVSYQQDLLTGESGQRLRRYWRKQLRDASFVTEFPSDFVRPSTFTGRAEVVPIHFPNDLARELSAFATEQGVTFPALMLAVIQALVNRYSGQQKFLIGTPFSGRLHSKFEHTAGFFVNMLPLRADVSGDVTFLDLVQNAANTFSEGLQNEALPLAEIVRDAQTPRDASRSPLFQVCCTFEKSHLRQEDGRAGYMIIGENHRTNFAGLEQESFPIPVQSCHYDLEFIFERSQESLNANICYCADLLDRSTAEQLANNVTGLATQLLRHPNQAVSDVPWFPGNVSRIQSRDDGAKDVQSPWIVETIRDIAASAPDRVALARGLETKTYAQVMREADHICSALAARGIGPGVYVPVVASRGPEVVPALLGVIAAGAALVPIDADEPAVTPGDLIEDTKAPVVIVDSHDSWSVASAAESGTEVVSIAELLSERLNSGVAPQQPKPDDLCYLIYTSGSSGRPKGVMTEHAAVDNTLNWRAETVRLQGDDSLLILLSHQFDAGFALIFTALVQGAKMVWSDRQASNTDALIELIVDQNITVLPTIPSMLALIIDHPKFGKCASLRQVWTGGETMPSDLPQRLRNRHPLPFWNFYGPTEAAIEATAANVRDHDANRVIPIGIPVHNTEILVLDSNRRPVPATVPGELAICGRGLARGYLGRPQLTAEKFPTLADGRRVFMTGDRGRKRADGSLEFLGRNDDQIKLGGYRIELQEIEQVLIAAPRVIDAAVKVHTPGDGPACLIGYVAAETANGTDSELDECAANIKEFIATRLAPFKRPRHVLVLPSLPKTSSGKVDKKRLPNVLDHQINDLPYVPPKNELEKFLASEFAGELGVNRVGANQDFFELGGTSLQAAVMASRLSDALELHVPTSLLFDMPVVQRIAERLAALHRDAIRLRFGEESVEYDAPNSSTEDGSDRSARHPLIADLGASMSPENQNRGNTTEGNPAPIFMVHPPGGIVACYRDLARLAGEQHPFFAIRSRGLHGQETLPASVEEMASDYVDAIRSTQPDGPYQIGGWSLGGIVAWEAARQLQESGRRVDRIILLDTAIPEGANVAAEGPLEPSPGLEYGLDFTLEELSDLDPEEQLPLLWEHAKNLGVLDDDTPQAIIDRALNDLKNLFHHHLDVIGKHKLEPLDLPVLLIRPTDVPNDVVTTKDRGWSSLARHIQVEFVPGHHHSMVKSPGAEEIARLIF